MSAETFLQFAESLKLVRKADPEFEGISVIEEIYTDLLPNNGIINKVNLPRTTLLIGRKGTGKSTIFLKSQKDLDKNKQNLTIYLDAKSLYDNSTPFITEEYKHISNEVTKYLIYSNLIKEIILQTKTKIQKRISQNAFINFLGLDDTQNLKALNELDIIQSSINSVFKELNASLITAFKNVYETSDSEKTNIGLNIGIDKASFKALDSDNHKSHLKKEFDSTLIRYLDIKKSFIENLLRVRDILGIKHLYIFLDDFSEINKEPQTLFVDWFVAPVNNLSEDFVKFKIAAYPTRFYYGKLDNSKIDEISLDFFDAFYSYERATADSDISKMESLALDYTKRLINNRVNIYFPQNNWEQFFDIPEEEIFQLFFKLSLNVPRKLGYILSYCYESSLIYNSKITVAALENASMRYYNDVIEKYFIVNEHICKPFNDIISDAHHYDLLKKIINRQLTNKVVLKRRRNNYTSHFLINNELTSLLSNLEINSFISTYNKIKDKNNVFSTVFCLDYGLCKKFQLKFGSPNTKNFEKAFSQQIYNFNSLVKDFFNSTQVIKCQVGHEYPYSEITEFQKFKMSCPLCLDDGKVSKCTVTLKYEDLRQRFLTEKEKGLKVTFPEFLILDFIRLSQKSLPLKTIGEATDYSLSTIKLNLNSLLEKGLIEYDSEATKQLKKEFLKITSKGFKAAVRIEQMIEEERQNKNAPSAQHG